ncbi:hypothetical protein ACP0AK_08890 [Listeria ivanovii]|uniref:DUF4870 domain-containing protein n=1 Tax=Listeria ivanovii (strain ATCC BAA-678 / PAM 55) TaxID=881621 RepID=G2ZBM6_LISIP|nr:membrane protein [Listeria ivanovii]AHI56690.1 hypothetical protein AX25_11560 [Listeria ivanovii WSLC3009]AIS66107.1 membrane protein [Listeria ivanovii subsp. ivanovii]MBC1760823.1 hypothetical protein [Listeria ivanovii]MBK3913871.1 hypothetical protein [Listeria ivanovii subsp. ivanovii]MBK3921291.1 hypothetical protein [Listeria ivanovii subsp. ivanovii]
MNDHRILNALSYFSIFFAPIIIPTLVWIFAKTDEVTHHAKVALLTHVIPTITGFICFSTIFFTSLTSISTNLTLIVTICLFFFMVITMVGFFIFNIVRGIQMLLTKPEEDVWI